jgi:hypothetical protein
MFFNRYRQNLIKEHKALTDKIYAQEQLCEVNREDKVEAETNSANFEADLWLATKRGPEKVTDAMMKYLIEANEELKVKKAGVVTKENIYKKSLVLLAHYKRQLNDLELELN